MGWRKHLLPLAVLLVLALIVLLPIAVLALYSVSRQWNGDALLPTRYTGEWYRYLFRYQRGLDALLLSVRVALFTTALTLLIGVPAAYALARYRVVGRALIDALFLAKTAVPVVLVGVGTAALFLRWGLHDTLRGIVLAHLVGALPLQIWTAAAAFERLDLRQEEAARDLGAGFIRRLWEVSLPGARGGIVAGAILAFLFSMDEFTVTFLISGVRYATLPLRLYSILNQGYIEPAAASAIVLLTPSLLYLLLAVHFLHRADAKSGIGGIG